ncbi:MAG TPA: universal stress protein [Anaeromyxobacteraceae bacterium]|nr:universal stress protein [Anaeromyxobacteraceae bacterium]
MRWVVALFKHILLATDLTEASARAHEVAADLASCCGARLTAVHVCATSGFAAAGSTLAGADLTGPSEQGAREELGRLVWRLRGRAVRAEALLRNGVPWENIVTVAREVGADLVVTGTHGRHGIAHMYYGSVAEKVVQESPVPVLTVPSARGH